MSDPQLLFCQIIEQQYNATVNTIEGLANFPTIGLRRLRAHIKRFESLTLAVAEGTLATIEAEILQLLELLKLDDLDKLNRFDFCAIAYRCLALRKSLFPENGNDPSYVLFIPQDVRDELRNLGTSDTYNTFEKYVCKLGLKRMMRNFVNGAIAELQRQLDVLERSLGVISKIDEWIQQYLDFITPFLRALQTLDQFGECAFATCNFVQTALNKQESLESRYNLERQGGGWSVKIDNILASVIQRDNEIRARIDELRWQLSQPKFGSAGQKLEDLMKL